MRSRRRLARQKIAILSKIYSTTCYSIPRVNFPRCVPGNMTSAVRLILGRAELRSFAAENPPTGLTSFHQFGRLWDLRFRFVAFDDGIEEPNNETVRQQNEHTDQIRMMPNIPHFERDQRCRRKYHQEFRPSLLHVNADAFRKKNRRVKERQKTSASHYAACEPALQSIEQVVDGLAVLHQNFVSGPVRQGIHPAGTCIEEEERNTEQKQ